MIYAYVEDHGADGTVEAPYTYDVSARQMAREARVTRAAAPSVATLKKSSYVLRGGGSGEDEAQRFPLLEALERLPDSRAYESWRSYEAAAVPLLDPTIAAPCSARRCVEPKWTDTARAIPPSIGCAWPMCRGLPQRSPPGVPATPAADPEAVSAVRRLPCIQHPPRRLSKRNFRSANNPELPLLVAFGDGRACSSGLGYCPAPQGRLRHHLARKHRAHVCHVDECRTSKTCSCCGNVLQDVRRCKTSGRARRPRNEKSVIWAVKKCVHCRGALPALTRRGLERWRRPHERAPAHHWRRDFNAAQNMKAVYYSLLETRQRPAHLRRREAGVAATASQQERGAAPRVRGPRGDVSPGRPSKRTKLCGEVRCLERA